jgi:hypothetical protein
MFEQLKALGFTRLNYTNGFEGDLYEGFTRGLEGMTRHEHLLSFPLRLTFLVLLVRNKKGSKNSSNED